MKFNRDKELALDAETLRHRVSYDADTGRMLWRLHRRSTAIGREIGSPSCGYRRVSMPEGYFQVHRLVWLYVHGEWPAEEIDHINGIRDDNRLVNLRVATASQNLANRLGKNGALKGITKVGNRWRAQIRENGRHVQIGIFDTPEDAAAAYSVRAAAAHGEFARSCG